MNPLTTMTITEKENVAQQYKSARSHDSGRTVLYPDLYVQTDDERWTMTPEAHEYAAAAGSFCSVTAENGEQQDIYNLTTFPGVQRSLCLEEVIDDSSSTQFELPNGVDNQTRGMLERCMATCGKAARARAKRGSRARTEAPAKEVRRYHNQFAEAKHLEWKSWIDNEVFDVVDMRKFKPKNCVIGRWVVTIKTDNTRQLPQGEGKMGTARFPRETEGLPTDRFSCVHKTRISDELPYGSQQKLGSFPR